MKILIVSANYPPLLGGPASSVPQLSKTLVKNGFEVHVLTQGYKGSTPLEIEDGVYVHRTAYIGGFKSPLSVIRKVLLMGFLGKHIIRKYNIDILHSRDMNISGLAGILINRKFNLPSLCQFGGDLAWEYISHVKWGGESPENLLRKNSIYINFFENVQRRIGKKYGIIAPNSEYQLNWLVNFTKIRDQKLVVLNNGIDDLINPKDVDAFRKSFGGHTTITAASRLVPWKGLQYLIEALKFINKDVRLVIAGNGPFESQLRKLVKKFGLDERVSFAGKIEHKKIQSYIKASDVYVLPSLYEPFPVALLDCLVAGTPIVSTNVGGIPEIIKNGSGLLAKAGNSKDLAEKINLVLSDKKIRDRMTQSQKTEVEKYLWKNLVNKYIEVYERLAGD